MSQAFFLNDYTYLCKAVNRGLKTKLFKRPIKFLSNDAAATCSFKEAGEIWELDIKKDCGYLYFSYLAHL